jgi:uncharacterized membrane protein
MVKQFLRGLFHSNTMDIFDLIEKIGELIDLFGVLVILLGAVGTTAAYVRRFIQQVPAHESYRKYRHGLARVILLGLEFLIAGDIIRSVAGEPTFASIGVLGLIVLIRSFLGIEFEMEVNGRWPWQPAPRRRKR